MNQRLEAFLSEIADFSNVGRRSGTLSPATTPGSDPKFGRSTDGFQEPDLNNNSKLIAQFRTMREKIRNLQRQNNEFKQTESSLNVEIENRYRQQLNSLQQKDAQNTAALNFLRKEMEQINSGIDQLKQRNTELQDQLTQKTTVECELEYLQGTVIQLKHSNDELKKEQDKLLQIGIMEKIDLQERLKTMQMTKEVDKHYVQQLEMELSKAREKCLTVEGKLRRLQNDIDESRFDRERLTESNNKSQDLEHLISELKKQRNKLKTALAEEKERRLKAESTSMEKEEFSSLYTIQIETLERDVVQLKKRNKKWAAKCEQKQLKAEQQAYKNIESKSKLYRSLQLWEECLGRIKRELNINSELLQFIKSCEYKLAKLKDEDEQGKSGRQSRSRSKSRSRVSISARKSCQEQLKSSKTKSKKKLEIASDEEEEESCSMSGRDNRKSETEDDPIGILKERNRMYSRPQPTFSGRDYEQAPTSKPLKKEDLDFVRSTFRESKPQLMHEQDPIDRKVRREREQKERKIRESILYRKMQACTDDRERSNIREQILKLGSQN